MIYCTFRSGNQFSDPGVPSGNNEIPRRSLVAPGCHSARSRHYALRLPGPSKDAAAKYDEAWCASLVRERRIAGAFRNRPLEGNVRDSQRLRQRMPDIRRLPRVWRGPRALRRRSGPSRQDLLALPSNNTDPDGKPIPGAEPLGFAQAENVSPVRPRGTTPFIPTTRRPLPTFHWVHFPPDVKPAPSPIRPRDALPRRVSETALPPAVRRSRRGV